MNYLCRYVYCEKCFNELKGDTVEITDDTSQPPVFVFIYSNIALLIYDYLIIIIFNNFIYRKIEKSEFTKEKNDKLDYEPLVLEVIKNYLKYICIVINSMIYRFVECDDCGRNHHTICVLHSEQIWPNG